RGSSMGSRVRHLRGGQRGARNRHQGDRSATTSRCGPGPCREQAEHVRIPQRPCPLDPGAWRLPRISGFHSSPPFRRRPAIPCFLIIVMGLSRIYLGHHWFSDVRGASLLGSLWLALTIKFYRWGKELFFRRQPAAPEAPVASPEPATPGAGH